MNRVSTVLQEHNNPSNHLYKSMRRMVSNLVRFDVKISDLFCFYFAGWFTPPKEDG